MFPKSDFYQNLCIYTKFHADSEFTIIKIKFEKKLLIFEKTKKLKFFPNSGHSLFFIEFALFDITASKSRIYGKKKHLQ
jgi:hypothetical protein